MNFSTPLLSLATTALDVAVQGVQDVVRESGKFADVFHLPGADQPELKDATKPSEDGATGSDPAPQPTQIGQQMQHAALRQRFETLCQALHRRMVARCAARGIELNEPAVLAVDSSGRVLETGTHWERARIEQLFEADSELRSDVAHVLELGKRLQNADSATARGDVSRTPRLVVGQKTAFFQMV